MRIPDKYHTLTGPAAGICKDRGSRFLSFAFPVSSHHDIDTLQQQIRSEHQKARHHCFAYRMISKHGVEAHFSDAGEPSGTAGRPILSQISNFELLQVLVIVVRYFGGTKLGTAGLIRAYREATRDALHKAKIREVRRQALYRLAIGHAYQPQLYEAVKMYDIRILEPEYHDKLTCKLSVPYPNHAHTVRMLFRQMTGYDFDTIAGYLEVLDARLEPLEQFD